MELEINITKTCRKELFDFIVDKMKNGYQFIKNVDKGFFWETIKKPGSRVVHLQFKHYLDKERSIEDKWIIKDIWSFNFIKENIIQKNYEIKIVGWKYKEYQTEFQWIKEINIQYIYKGTIDSSCIEFVSCKDDFKLSEFVEGE